MLAAGFQKAICAEIQNDNQFKVTCNCISNL